MPLAQAHPFEPMPVTHEEDVQEVRACDLALRPRWLAARAERWAHT